MKAVVLIVAVAWFGLLSLLVDWLMDEAVGNSRLASDREKTQMYRAMFITAAMAAAFTAMFLFATEGPY